MRLAHRFIGLAAACAGALGVAWVSQVPLSSGRDGTALLRLTWRARPERIEHCVTQSAEALAELPVHMRQKEICEGISASYRLELRLDGEVVTNRVVSPGGLRHDRPLYVFREVAVPAGRRHVQVRFERIEAPSDRNEPNEPNEERELFLEAVPAALVWDETLTFQADSVHVLSYDPEQRVLFEVVPSPAAAR